MSRYLDQCGGGCVPILYGWRTPRRAPIPAWFILCDDCVLYRSPITN